MRQRNRPACAGEDPELWFPVGETGPSELQTLEAKSICHTCPLELACLTEALSRGIEFGIWGGMTPRERRVSGRRKQIELRSKDADHRSRTDLVSALAS